MRRGVVLAAVLFLALTSAADARRPRMTFEFAQMVAADYWAKRGVQVPCHPRVRVLPYNDETRSWLRDTWYPEMMATPEQCLVEVMPWTEEWRTDPNPESRADYCWDVAHEVGHLAGLEHPDYKGNTPARTAWLARTVMNPDGAPYPFGCEHPRRFLRRRARLASARSPS